MSLTSILALVVLIELIVIVGMAEIHHSQARQIARLKGIIKDAYQFKEPGTIEDGKLTIKYADGTTYKMELYPPGAQT